MPENATAADEMIAAENQSAHAVVTDSAATPDPMKGQQPELSQGAPLDEPQLYERPGLDDIVAKSRAQFNAEIAEQEDAAAPSEIEEAGSETAPPAHGEPAAGTDDGSTVAVKVLGDTYRVAKADVDLAGGVANYQKNAAADRYMADARQMHAQVQAAQQQPADQRAQRQPETQAADLDDEAHDRAAKIVQALQYGEEDEAVDELAKTLRAGAGSVDGPAVEQIVHRSMAKAVHQVQRRQAQVQAIESFAQQYPQIAADPGLQQHLKFEIGRVQAFDQEHGYQRSDADALNAAGELTTKWLAEVTGRRSQAPARTARLEEKRRLSHQPQRAAARAPMSAAPYQAASPSEVVRRMQEARGQA